MTLVLLEYHTEWMHLEALTERQCQWIFGLLAKVDKLLTSDQMASLRALCRACLDRRNDMVCLYSWQ